MRNQIIPSIIAKNQNDLDKRLAKVKEYTGKVQLDVMDGKFVKNKSLWFDFNVSKNLKYEAHLMIKNPINWIEKHWKKVDTIIFHIESIKNSEDIIKLIKKKKKKVGIAINPRTQIKKIKPYLKKVDMILIMTVNPGEYGAKFLPSMLKKVKELRKLKPKLNIEVDGSINDKTILKSKKSGANMFVSGSYLQKSKNIKNSLSSIKSILKRR